MDYEILGFIKANKHRHRILEILCSGFSTQREISHRLRIPELIVVKTIDELLGKELVEKSKEREEDRYFATQKGKKTLRTVAK
jgi:DNA-binding MarR family transcriptional regulator|tara:strand:- start:16986 stop:17234 length:249 start_codon:yes stop_codon:yes gene_type:complete